MSDTIKNSSTFLDLYEIGSAESDKKSVLHEGSDSGEGFIKRFEIAPGIQITYNDLKMDSCFQPICFEKDFLQINHCLEGCYECELSGGAVSFLGEGDLCVDYLSKDKQVFLGSRIPLKKYRGITVLLEMETAQKTLDDGFQQAHISLTQIRDRLCSDGRSLIIKSKHKRFLLAKYTFTAHKFPLLLMERRTGKNATKNAATPEKGLAAVLSGVPERT